MSEIEAVYEGGVFRPVGPVELPERTRVRVTVPAPPAPAPSFRDVLARRYESGHADTAARHDEHQP